MSSARHRQGVSTKRVVNDKGVFFIVSTKCKLMKCSLPLVDDALTLQNGKGGGQGGLLGTGFFFPLRTALLRTGPDLEFSPFSPVPEKLPN